MPARKKATRKKAGPKKIVFDLSQIEGFGKIGATMEEMANVLGCSPRTIERRMAENDERHDDKFRAAYHLGNSSRRMSLRRAQTQAALGGNPTMLIWLGKQELDQVDMKALDVVAKVEAKMDPSEELAMSAELIGKYGLTPEDV